MWGSSCCSSLGHWGQSCNMQSSSPQRWSTPNLNKPVCTWRGQMEAAGYTSPYRWANITQRCWRRHHSRNPTSDALHLRCRLPTNGNEEVATMQVSIESGGETISNKP
ncbi:hypothetical protein XENTR_v10017629 [Xenopus tropicalis]|nr:hypothetical protein XENTR_v10017629 [Xenopus tropicalis]